MPPQDETAATESKRFACEQCGADLRFAPGRNALACDHCGHEEPLAAPAMADLGGVALAEGAVTERDYRAALAEELAAARTEAIETAADEAAPRAAHCADCGATTRLPVGVHADLCAFCAGPIVLGTDAARRIKPGGVLPFDAPEDVARTALREWLEGLWFAPSGLDAYARPDGRLEGVYLPFWTFDAKTRSRYRGQRGDAYFVSEQRRVRHGKGWKTVPQQVRKIRWTRASGQVRRTFDDVLILASRGLPAKLTRRLGASAWDLGALVPYQPDYLAGFQSESYGVSLEDGYAAARAEMDQRIRRDVLFDIGGDAQRVDHIATEVDAVTFKHILAPVWIAAYRYRGDSYRVLINGRTGEVSGERPYSIWKIALAAGAALLLAIAIGAILAAIGVFN